MPLSTLDLASSFFGWWSFGFSLWFAIPQVGKLYELKPEEGGPSFILLSMWLVGDIAQAVGVFVIGGLGTQKASMICFAVATSIITLQLLYYRGYIPFNSFWTKRKERRPAIDQLVSGVHREPKYTQRSLGRGSSTSTEIGDEEKAPLRIQRLDRRVYRDSSSNNSTSRGKRRCCGKLPKVWTDFDGWRVNSSGYLLVTVVMISVWTGVDFVRRNKADVKLEVALPPSTQVEKIGWGLGWFGTVLYNAPRVYQLYKTFRFKSVSAISAFSFASLVLQNITMLISIVSVSHTKKTTLAQAPYLANLASALSADVIFLFLYRLYRNNPRPVDSDRPWSDPDWMYSHYTPRDGASVSTRAATGRIASHQARQQYQHGLYLPPVPPPLPKKPNAKFRPLPPQQTELRRQVEINGGNHDIRKHLEQAQTESLEAEQAWPQQRDFMPFLARGRREKKLNERAEGEEYLSRLLEESSSEYSPEENAEHSSWVKKTSEERKNLEKLRKKRLGKINERLGDSGYASASHSSSDSGRRRRSSELIRSDRQRSIGKSRRHPRRGVGTSSEEEDFSSE